ncbi:MAG: hypothetical protein AB9856_04585 [Cellulosilyticaceae bacterium]
MDWLKKFMLGRYGFDQLGVGLMILAIILVFLTSIIQTPIISVLTYIPLIYCYFRVFSKNISKRRQENTYFLRYWNPIANKFKKLKARLKGMKTHRYYKCPNCHQELRVPKGRGNIKITCPKCQHTFSKRT